MSRRHHYKRNHVQVELEITTLLNVMVVLISFLLLTAVFSKLAIQEMNLPAAMAGAAAPAKPEVTIEVIVRKNALEIGDGKSAIASIPMVDKKYDLNKLSQILQRLKEQYKDKQDATILIEPDIEYEYLIAVMDTVKTAQVKRAGEVETTQKLSLFPQVSIGDAP